MSEAGETRMQHCQKRMEEQLRCSICQEYFKDPVILDCGHNFCHTCITNYWGESPTDPACPQCKETTQEKRLKPNMQMANMIEITKDMNHLLKHCFVSVEDAAQKCKEQIKATLEFLTKERENIMLYQSKNETESEDLLKQMQLERQKITAAFGDLRQYLDDKQRLLLAQMDEVNEDISKKRDEYQNSLSDVLSNYKSLINELLKKLKQSANEVVQNFRQVLERCPKEPFNNPVVFPVEVKWKVHDFSDISSFLEGLMKQFEDFLRHGLQLEKVSVTLDPKTAHPKIILSEDCKSLRLGTTSQDLPDYPERFDTWTFVLGKERMNSGRYFWEVAVESEEEWSVGVARYNVKRKGMFDVCSREGIWQFGMWGGGYKVHYHPVPTALPLNQKVKKIRVTLNCIGGRLAFFDADTGNNIYTYSDASLIGETLLPFFYVHGSGELKVCP